MEYQKLEMLISDKEPMNAQYRAHLAQSVVVIGSECEIAPGQFCGTLVYLRGADQKEKLPADDFVTALETNHDMVLKRTAEMFGIPAGIIIIGVARRDDPPPERRQGDRRN